MSTFNAFYVRKHGADDATKAAIARLYPKADIQMLPEFVGAILSRDDIEPPEQKLKEVSGSLGADVIWVTFQTTAESFIFHHWRAGEQLRALWYGCADEGVWGRAEGEAEPWEAEEFWSEDALEGALECAENEAEQQKLRRLWKDRAIRRGQTDPSVSSEDAVHAVMDHYGLFDPNQTETTASGDTAATPVPQSTGVRVFRALVWVAIIFVIVFLLWKRSK
jgi:hypothetical protein